MAHENERYERAMEAVLEYETALQIMVQIPTQSSEIYLNVFSRLLTFFSNVRKP
jgi:hypothetical protein